MKICKLAHQEISLPWLCISRSTRASAEFQCGSRRKRRNGKFVADLAAQRSGLRKFQVMGIAGWR